MHNNEAEKLDAEIGAGVAGVSLGLLAGFGLGALLATVTGSFSSPLCIYIIMHSGFAMAIMGAWLLPAMLPSAEPGEPVVDETT